MKIKLNSNTIKRVISNDDSCINCWFNSDTVNCKLPWINLCTNENICYVLHPYKSDDSIFSI